MRVLMLDLDTLRPDHMGCYGYFRDTTPNLDSIARDGVRLEHCHCSDAPCLPSRAALQSGRFGYHNGAVGHGGLAADMRPLGRERDFNDQLLTGSFFNIFRKAGMYTASISPFAERHSSYWFTAGFNELHNTGKCGGESAEEVMPVATKWLEEHGKDDNWFLHINFWDAHTPYRAPAEFGEPFADKPLPEWLTEEVFNSHLKATGPHGAWEIGMYNDHENPRFPRHPGKITDMAGLRRMMDGYDTGILYMDKCIGQLIDMLKGYGVYEDTAIIITADHGENMGELALYGEHATADEITTRIPMVIKWPGAGKNVALEGKRYNLDLVPTVAELLDIPASKYWDGQSYAKELLGEKSDEGRPYLVVSQCAHVCQRGVRFGDYLYVRTYHDGFHLWDKEMLFDLAKDPHEQFDIKDEHPELCAMGCRYLVDWEQEMIATGDGEIDPMVTVLKEGGPYHAGWRIDLEGYCKRLESTGRGDGAKALREKYLK